MYCIGQKITNVGFLFYFQRLQACNTHVHVKYTCITFVEGAQAANNSGSPCDSYNHSSYSFHITEELIGFAIITYNQIKLTSEEKVLSEVEGLFVKRRTAT